jgi:hypothetical protein
MVFRPSRIGRVLPLNHQLVRFQTPETFSKDIRSDPFFGGQEVLERVAALEHQVTNNKQRPTVAEDLQ